MEEDTRAAPGPLGRALLDHLAAPRRGRVLRVHMDGAGARGRVQRMPVALFFRAGRSLRPIDRQALAQCRGRVLDAGAGAGALALALQDAGHDVTALEVLPAAVDVMRARGVRDARLLDVRALQADAPYDTVLAMMNGTAPAGTLAGLAPWLAALAAPLAPGGRVVIDSTDLREPGSRPVQRDGRYVGELHYQVEYAGEKGAPFPQLFVDPRRLRRAARDAGLAAEIVWADRAGSYLARLERSRS